MLVVVEGGGCKCASAEQLLPPDLHSHLPPPTASRSNGITLDPLSPVSLWARDLDSFGAEVNRNRGVRRLNGKLSPWPFSPLSPPPPPHTRALPGRRHQETLSVVVASSSSLCPAVEAVGELETLHTHEL